MCELFKRERKLQVVLVMVAEGEVSDYRPPRQPVAPVVLVLAAEGEVTEYRRPRQSVAPKALALKKVTALQERLM